VIAWIWLEQLNAADGRLGDFYDGKQHAARYFYVYELPRIMGHDGQSQFRFRLQGVGLRKQLRGMDAAKLQESLWTKSTTCRSWCEWFRWSG
jgi:hypothetical protein